MRKRGRHREEYNPNVEYNHSKDNLKVDSIEDNRHYNDGFDEYNDGFDEYNDGFDEYNDGFDEYNDGFDDYSEGFDDYSEGFDNYNDGFNWNPNTYQNMENNFYNLPYIEDKYIVDSNSEFRGIIFEQYTKHGNNRVIKQGNWYTKSPLGQIMLENGLVLDYKVNFNKGPSGYYDQDSAYWGKNLIEIFINIITEYDIQGALERDNDFMIWYTNTDRKHYRNINLDYMVHNDEFPTIVNLDYELQSNLRTGMDEIGYKYGKIKGIGSIILIPFFFIGRILKNLFTGKYFREGRTQATDNAAGSFIGFFIFIFIAYKLFN